MKKFSPFLIATAVIALAACTPANQNTNDTESGTTIEDNETKNVLYRGTLEEAGMSIFMQGTHKLALEDGRFIMLESDVVNLGRYVGQEVEVYGSTRATVEEGGTIMRVESVTSMEESSSSSSADTSTGSSVSSSSVAAAAATSSVTVAQTTSSSSSSAAPVAAASSVPAWEGSDELSAKAEVMAKNNMAAANWTQQYCPRSSNFCIPVHRNWWYTSLGATSSAVLHIEIGPSEIANLGDGPLTVRIVSGDVSATGMADKGVTVQNGTAFGVRSWTNGRHIEVRAPAILEAAVRYITENLQAVAG
jgi:hypothetical protein